MMPSESMLGGSGWWQENAVIGRLSALSRRYYSVKLLTRPLSVWRQYTLERKPKRDLQYQREVCLKLRLWLLRVRWRRYRHQLPLFHAVRHPTQQVLRAAWDRLRGRPSPECLEKLQKVSLAKVVRGRMRNSIARCHHARLLLQRAFASFWLTSLQNGHSTPGTAPGSGRRRSSVSTIASQRRRSSVRVSQSSPQGAPTGSSSSSDHRALEEEQGPLTVLVQLQHKCWQRWHQNCLMQFNREEWNEERRKAAVLLMIRDSTRTSMAMTFRVFRLLHRSFEGLLINVDGDEATAFEAARQREAAGDVGRQRRRHPGSRVRPPPSPGRSVPRGARAARQGLRGTSAAEVLRKGWWRWRFASAVEPTWAPVSLEEQRPLGATASLFSIAEGVKDARRLGSSLAFSQRSPMEVQGDLGSAFGTNLGLSQCSPARGSHPASQTQLANSPTLLPSTEMLADTGGWAGGTNEPPHLALLQKALASFDRVSNKTPPRQRPPAMWQVATELPPSRFGFTDDLEGRAMPVRLAAELSSVAADLGPHSLWSTPAAPSAPRVEATVNSSRGAVSGNWDSPRQSDFPMGNGSIVGFAEEQPRSPSSLRRASRLNRPAGSDSYGFNRQPSPSPAEPASELGLLWQSGSLSPRGDADGEGSPVDLTLRSGMARNESTPSLNVASGGSPSRGFNYHSRVNQSALNAFESEDTLIPETSFVLSNGAQTPTPWENQDYGALKKRLLSKRLYSVA